MGGDLKELSPEYTVLLDALPTAVLIAGADLDAPGPTIRYVNAAFEKMTGWPREDVVGSTPRFLQGPATDRKLFASMRRALRAGRDWRGETTTYRRDGRPFIMRWSISPLKTEGGEIWGHLALQEDVTSRRERDRVAQQKQSQISRFVDAALDGVIITDSELAIRRVNSGAERIFGWPRDALLGAPIDALIPERLRARHHQHVEKFRAEKTMARWMHGRSDIVGLRRNGDEFPAVASIVRTGDDADGFAVFLRDLSEKRTSEARLRDSERRFRALFEMSYQGACILDPEGRVADANRPALDYAGVELDDVAGLYVCKTRWFADNPVAVEIVTDAVSRAQQGEWVKGELHLFSRNAKAHIFDFSLRPVLDRTGSLTYMIFETRNITPLVQARDDVYAKEAHLREAQRIAKIGHWRLLAGGRRIEASDGFRRLIDKPSDKKTMPLTEFLEAMPEADRKAMRRSLMEIKAGADHLELEHSIDLPTGSTRMMLTRLTRTPIQDGVTVMAVTQDVSVQHANEAALGKALRQAEQANQAKANFLAMIGHELRTPLNAINGFSEMISSELAGPIGERRYIEYAAAIQGSGQHLLQLIDGILDVSRLERNAVTLRPEPLSAARLLRETAQLFRREQRDKESDLTLAGIDEARLDADPAMLQQATLNLLRSAAKFSPTGGTVSLKGTLASDGGYRIQVADAGPGIPEAELDRVATPFYQIDCGLDRRHDGSGIGLFLTKSFIELHGGKLTLENREVGGLLAAYALPKDRVCAPAAHKGETCGWLPCPVASKCKRRAEKADHAFSGLSD